jgi:drug/metabolite transporter (DMT)-like permease
MAIHGITNAGGATSTVLLVAAYLTLNSTLNLMNKWALGRYGLRFPLTLTSTHMAFSFVILAPFALRTSWDEHRHTLKTQWKGLLYVGGFLALNIALNNISLVDITLSLNQVIRSAIPVATCLLAIAVEGHFPTRLEATALLLLCMGVMVAVWQGSVTGEPRAIFVCILGTMCNAAMMTFTGKLMSEKLDVVRMTFYTAPISLVCLFPFFVWRELSQLASYYSENSHGVAAVLVASSVNAVCYNLVHSAMIKRTSAVTTTVLGELKIVGLLVLSALLLGEGREFTLKMTLGCGLAMLGFTLYTHSKIVGIQKAQDGLPRVAALAEMQPLKHVHLPSAQE